MMMINKEVVKGELMNHAEVCFKHRINPHTQNAFEQEKIALLYRIENQIDFEFLYNEDGDVEKVFIPAEYERFLRNKSRNHKRGVSSALY